MEARPAIERHVRNRDRAVFHPAIQGVHRELVPDEVVGDKHGILRAARAPAGNLSRLCALRRENVERFPAAAGAEEESAEHPGAGEGQQPGICPRGGSESGDDFRLFAVHHPHHGEFPEEMQIARLEDDPVIPTHGARRLRRG